MQWQNNYCFLKMTLFRPFLLHFLSLSSPLLPPILLFLSYGSLFLLFLLLSCPPSFTFLLHQVLQSSEINLQLANGEVATLQEVIQPDPSSGQIPYGEFATHAADVIASLYQNQPASDVSGRGYLSSFAVFPIVQFPTLQVIKIWKGCLGMCKDMRSSRVHLIIQLSRLPFSQTSPIVTFICVHKHTTGKQMEVKNGEDWEWGHLASRWKKEHSSSRCSIVICTLHAAGPCRRTGWSWGLLMAVWWSRTTNRLRRSGGCGLQTIK